MREFGGEIESSRRIVWVLNGVSTVCRLFVVLVMVFWQLMLELLELPVCGSVTEYRFLPTPASGMLYETAAVPNPSEP